MLMNLFHPVFNPLIKCDSISTEGFEIDNLVSSDNYLFKKGFLAERFISGPVIITVKFICPVSVKYVIIWSKVSNQKSSGFELSLCSDNNDIKKFASGIIQNDADGIIFYKEGYKLDLSKYSSEVKSFPQRTFCRNKNYENIGIMQIKIFKFRYVPAINKIEVWGEPSHLCDSEMKNYVIELWDIIKNSSNITISLSHRNMDDNNIGTSFLHLNEEIIPEEFYDEITHELMTLPMILPSGKIIDHRTLEKFQNEESKWGRLPSDPFTGVIFTQNIKPVIAASLKSRIDSFLLKNSDLEVVKELPRRLGSENESFSSDYKISKIVERNNEKKFNSGKNYEHSSTIKTRRKRPLENLNITFKNTNFENTDLDKMVKNALHNLPSFTSDRNVKEKDAITYQGRISSVSALTTISISLFDETRDEDEKQHSTRSSTRESRTSSPVPESSDIGTSPPLHQFEDESEIIPQGEPLQLEDEEDNGEELFGDNLEA
ncbi:hypothetical protein PGB90_001746 [Kerria lacca]